MSTITANKVVTKRNTLDILAKVNSTINAAVKKTITPKTSTFHNENCENKDKARRRISRYVIKSNIVGVVPTLPKTSWAIELYIAQKKKNMCFLGVEMCKETYEEMKQERLNLGVHGDTYHGKLSDIIYAGKRNSYAHIIADYCGCPSTFIPEMTYVTDKKIIQKGGILAMTFSMVRDGKIGRMFNVEKAPCKSNFNLDSAPVTEIAINKWLDSIETKGNFKVVEKYRYSDTQPMVLIVLQRIK